MTFTDIADYARASGVSFSEWEATTLVEMGAELTLQLQNMEPSLPPLTTDTLDHILGAA